VAFLLIILFVGGTVSLFAQDRVPLSECLDRAFRNNAGLEAEYRDWQSLRRGVRVAGSLEDPKLGWTEFEEPIQTRVGEQERAFSLSQMIPFPGKLPAKQALARKMAEKKDLMYQKAVRDLVVNVKKEYAELWFLEEARNTARKNQEVLREILGMAEAKQTETMAPLQEILRAQAQDAQVGYDVVTYDELREVHQERLNALMNRQNSPAILPDSLPLPAFLNTLGKPVSIKDSLDEFGKAAREKRLELLISRKDVEASERELALSRFSRLPDFTIGYNLYQIGSRPDRPAMAPEGEGRDARAFSLMVNLPVWGGKNSAQIAVAREKMESARSKLKQEEQNTRAMLKEAWFALVNTGRLRELYKVNLIPQAFKAVQTSDAWRRERVGGVADVLEAQSTFYALTVAGLRAEADYFKSFAELERIVGVPLGDWAGETDEKP
jgi:outer membrane protein TolC